MKAILATLLAGAVVAGPAHAESYGQYFEPTYESALPHSFLTRDSVIVPPYGPLPIRVYTTPQAGPYYNVPPYRVIAPY